jgi:hypothetical protein
LQKTHEDLADNIEKYEAPASFTGELDRHGAHVAGILGAMDENHKC